VQLFRRPAEEIAVHPRILTSGHERDVNSELKSKIEASPASTFLELSGGTNLRGNRGEQLNDAEFGCKVTFVSDSRT
jgi:hypothetical protein